MAGKSSELPVQSKHQQQQRTLSCFISFSDKFSTWILRPEVLLVLIVLIVSFLILWHQMLAIFMSDFSPSTVKWIPSEVHSPGDGLHEYKFILVWSGCFGLADCGWGGSSYFFKNSLGCPEHRCMVITDHKQLAHADIVVFHIRDIHAYWFRLDMPTYHDPDQLWVFFSQESPHNTYIDDMITRLSTGLSNLDGLFNATMTYMRDSEFFLPYNTYRAKPQPYHDDLAAVNKTRLLLWVVSNCKPDSTRFEYVAELKKHIAVDIYGDCGKKHPCGRNRTCSKALLEHYKFYLAFENSECRDYITEKFWDTLMHGVVPVVLGATLAEYEVQAPPNSFIHVDNFTSIRALARYLLYLDSNPSQYNKYLEWRKNYTIGGRQRTEALCKMCSVAHNKTLLETRSYKISEWFSVHRLCRERRRS